MPSFKLITPPATEPVTLDEAKVQARIDSDTDDAFVTSLITAARQWAESFTGRAFIQQDWQLWFDCLPDDGEIILPRPPLISVTAINSYDENDTSTLWDAGNYFTDTIREPGRIALRTSGAWPVASRAINGIGIEYRAGYGADAITVPEIIRTAIRQLVAHWYEHRGEAATTSTVRGSVVSPIVPVPFVIQALLEPYRIRRI